MQYIALQDFVSYTQGKIKKGDLVEFNQTFLDHGLIEEMHETKPEPKSKKKVETK